MISNFKVDLVRTKYDYDKLVPASWQSVYPWNEQTGKLPLLVITPYLHDEGVLPNEVEVQFTYILPKVIQSGFAPFVAPDVTGVRLEDDINYIVNFSQTPDNILVLSAYDIGFYNPMSPGDEHPIVYDDDTMTEILVQLYNVDSRTYIQYEYKELTLDDCKAIADRYLRNQGKTNLANLVYRLARLAFKE